MLVDCRISQKTQILLRYRLEEGISAKQSKYARPKSGVTQYSITIEVISCSLYFLFQHLYWVCKYAYLEVLLSNVYANATWNPSLGLSFIRTIPRKMSRSNKAEKVSWNPGSVSLGFQLWPNPGPAHAQQALNHGAALLVHWFAILTCLNALSFLLPLSLPSPTKFLVHDTIFPS